MGKVGIKCVVMSAVVAPCTLLAVHYVSMFTLHQVYMEFITIIIVVVCSV